MAKGTQEHRQQLTPSWPDCGRGITGLYSLEHTISTVSYLISLTTPQDTVIPI